MATYTLQTPAVPSFNAPSTVVSTEIKPIFERIIGTYGEGIRLAAKNTNVPAPLIAAWIASYSKGLVTHVPASNPRYGLMGWNRKMGKAILDYEKKSGRMTAAEEAALKKANLEFDSVKGFPEISETQQANGNLNILIGALYLGQIIDKFAVPGKNLSLDKTIVLYNNGTDKNNPAVALAMNPQYSANALMLMNSLKTVDPFSSSQIGQLLGVGGYLSAATKQRAQFGLDKLFKNIA